MRLFRMTLACAALICAATAPAVAVAAANPNTEFIAVASTTSPDTSAVNLTTSARDRAAPGFDASPANANSGAAHSIASPRATYVDPG